MPHSKCPDVLFVLECPLAPGRRRRTRPTEQFPPSHDASRRPYTRPSSRGYAKPLCEPIQKDLPVRPIRRDALICASHLSRPHRQRPASSAARKETSPILLRRI